MINPELCEEILAILTSFWQLFLLQIAVAECKEMFNNFANNIKVHEWHVINCLPVKEKVL